MAFDITSVLKDTAAKTQAGRKQLEHITLHLIDPNPKNLYSMDGIRELANNIEAVGLMEPLIVKRMNGGRYMVISGHRRRAALRMIAERAENYPESMSEKVPCIVEDSLDGLDALADDPDRAAEACGLLEELKLLYANSDTRVLSSADTAMQVRRIRELLTELRDLGYALPGKLRDHVAAASKVSASRIARLDVIDKGLKDPRLRKAWEDGQLGETNAYEIARRPEAVQKALSFGDIDFLCHHATTEQAAGILDSVAKDLDEMNEGRRGLETMRAASPADSFSAENYLAQRAKEDEDFAEMLDPFAEMFFLELKEVKSRQDGIETLKRIFRNRGAWGKFGWDGSGRGLTLHRNARESILRTWTEVYDLLCLDALYRVAQLQEADAAASIYEKESEPEWHGGDPMVNGRYLCMVDMQTGKLHEQRCDWKDGTWYVYGNPIHEMFTVVYWYQLPSRTDFYLNTDDDDEEDEE